MDAARVLRIDPNRTYIRREGLPHAQVKLEPGTALSLVVGVGPEQAIPGDAAQRAGADDDGECCRWTCEAPPWAPC